MILKNLLILATLLSLEVPTSLEELRGHKIAVMTGSVQDIVLSSQDFESDLCRLSSPSDMFVSLTTGHSEYVFLDSTAVIGSGMAEKGVKCLFTSDPSGGYGFAFNKKSTDLCNSVNAYVKRIKENGKYQKLKEKYISGEFIESDLPHFNYKPDAKPLAVGTAAFFPFAFIQDKEWIGFDLEIIFGFCEEAGYYPVIQNIDFNGLIAAVVTGKVDIISSAISITEERKKNVLFSDSYFDYSTGCFAFSTAGPEEKSGFFDSIKKSFNDNFLVEDRWTLVVDGLWETIIISLFSILLGAILGVLICALRLSKHGIIRNTTSSLCSIVAGIPILVFLMVMYYIVFKTSGISGRMVAIIAFAINFACSISGVYLTGVSSVDKGQTEAGLALGFTPATTFMHIVLPQAAKKILPLFKGEAVSLIKNTSIVGYIAIQDLTKMCDIIRSRTFDAFFPLIAISIIYLLLSWAFGKLIDLIGKSFDYDKR